MRLSKVVIGLGNPGRKYAFTRHNLGWLVLDEIADSMGSFYETEKWGGLLGVKGEMGLFRPMTYMNASGEAVGRLLRALKLEMSDMLIVLDDLALELGRIRMRGSGTSGGHKGLESVIEHTGSDEFPRLRAGIGPCPPEVPSRAFVLGRFHAAEEQVLSRVVALSKDAALFWVEYGLQKAMDRFNGLVIESGGQ